MYNPGMKHKEKKMSQVYKEKIFSDIETIPVNLLPKLYRIVHLLKKKLVYPKWGGAPSLLARPWGFLL